MRDVSHRNHPPGDWQQALAALPLETPPPDGWNLIAARLSAHRLPSVRRRRWRVALAAAATLAAVTIVPALWWSTPEPATPVAAAPPTTPANPQPPAVIASEKPNAVTGVLPPMPAASGAHSGASSNAPATTVAAATKAVRTPAQRSPRNIAADTATATSAQTAPAVQPALESLYVESAHLESLLAQIQDERVASGPAMAMAGALEDRIAAIDHALSQPGNDDVEQRELWQQRVDALRQLAGLEGTQRWLAASGNPGSDGSRIY